MAAVMRQLLLAVGLLAVRSAAFVPGGVVQAPHARVPPAIASRPQGGLTGAASSPPQRPAGVALMQTPSDSPPDSLELTPWLDLFTTSPPPPYSDIGRIPQVTTNIGASTAVGTIRAWARGPTLWEEHSARADDPALTEGSSILGRLRQTWAWARGPAQNESSSSPEMPLATNFAAADRMARRIEAGEVEYAFVLTGPWEMSDIRSIATITSDAERKLPWQSETVAIDDVVARSDELAAEHTRMIMEWAKLTKREVEGSPPEERQDAEPPSEERQDAEQPSEKTGRTSRFFTIYWKNDMASTPFAIR